MEIQQRLQTQSSGRAAVGGTGQHWLQHYQDRLGDDLSEVLPPETPSRRVKPEDILSLPGAEHLVRYDDR